MKVAIIKYNAGNIYSVDYALKRLGVEAVVTADKDEIAATGEEPPVPLMCSMYFNMS